jgi:hypothetical protein
MNTYLIWKIIRNDSQKLLALTSIFFVNMCFIDNDLKIEFNADATTLS